VDLKSFLAFLTALLAFVGLVVGVFLLTRWVFRKTKGFKGWALILRIALVALPSIFAVFVLVSSFIHKTAAPPPYPRAEAPSEEPVPNPAHTPPLPHFPWPPPKPSARLLIPHRVFSDSRTLGDEAGTITEALRSKGYAEITYWSVPDGVAVVTRLEHIYPDGRPFASGRWAISDEGMQTLSIRDYINRLFGVDEGFYRVVVFVITDQGFGSSAAQTSEAEAQGWLSDGFQALPEELAATKLSSRYSCTALIYEFRKAHGQAPALLLPSQIGAQEHMVASGLWSAIVGTAK
jgi:hypothetical protein